MSIETVWAFGANTDREEGLSLIAQDGDMSQVELEDKSIDIGRKPIIVGVVRAGRRVRTDNLPTKLARYVGRTDEPGRDALSDLEGAHTALVVTGRFKNLVDDMCGPETHQFEPVEVVNALPGEDRDRWWFFCAVRLHALDADKIDPPLNHNGYYPITKSPAHAVAAFKKSVVGDHHLFCTAEWRGPVFASDEFRDACAAARITGADFACSFPVL